MSDEPDNLMLVYLRRLDGKLDDLRADVTELKQRMTSLEIQLGNQSATEASHYAQIMQRLDRHDTKLDRIERRLDIADVTVAE